MENITEEEYLLANKNIDVFKEDLFNLRMEHAKCNDIKKQEI